MLGSLNIPHASIHHGIYKHGQFLLNVMEKGTCAKKKIFWQNYTALIYENTENIWMGIQSTFSKFAIYCVRLMGGGGVEVFFFFGGGV
jgi:hypothetical protein